MAAVAEAFALREIRPRIFRARIDTLSYLSEKQIVERYRLSTEGIIYLEELIRADCEPMSDRSHSLNVRTKLLVTLRYLAKGDFYSEVGDLHGVSRSSVCRCIQQVISAINRNLNNITFPTSLHDLAATKQKFHRVAGIPNVIGAVDGTLIPIQAPSENPQTYVCRKGYHAVNIQAVVDSSLRFTNVNAKWPGSTHDATVFDNSSLKDHLAINKPGWLLGDSGYQLREYLITPKNNPQTAQELGFNGAHSRTRICVERAFGLLKARFRCLHRSGGVLPFCPGKCMEVVVVCAKLHNLCLDLKIPFDNEEEEVDIDEDPQILYPEGNNQQCRQRIIAMF